MKKIIFILLTIKLLTSPLWAQNIQISGTVIDAEERIPLIGASVIGNQGENGVVTDLNGQFTIDLTKRDTIVLEISYIGYEKQSRSFPSPTDDISDVSILLKEESTEIGEVVISAAKFEQRSEEVTISIVSIDAESIDQQASSNIKKVLDQTPGVVTYQNQINIRGSNGYSYGVGSRVLLLLDGLPMITSDLGSVDFEFMPTDNLQKLEVTKGAASVLYGTGALGGVISAFTKRPSSTPRTSVRLRQEVFDRPKNTLINWAGAEKALGVSLHTAHSQRFGNLDFNAQVDLIKDDGHREQEFQNTARGNFSLHYFPEKWKGLRIGTNIGLSTEKSALFVTWNAYPDSALYQGKVSLTSQTVEKVIIDPRISYITPKGNKHLYMGRNYISYRNTDSGNSNSATLFNEYQYTHHFSDNFTLISGLNYTYSRVKAVLFGNHTGSSMGIFTQAEAKIGDRLNLSAGARYARDEIEGEELVNQPIFRAGANLRLHKATYLRGSIGQGVRSPSVAERYSELQVGALVIVPNINVGAEKGYSAEAGIRQLLKFGKWKGMMDIAAFQMRFDDMIEFQVADADSIDFFNLVAPFQAKNINNARINGLEFMLGTQGSIGPLNIGLQGGYTYIDPIDLNGDPNQDDNYNVGTALLDTLIFPNPFSFEFEINPDQPRTLKYRNEHLARASLNLSYGQLDFTTNYRYSSAITNYDKIFFFEPWMLREPIVTNMVESGTASQETAENLADIVEGLSDNLVPGLYDYFQTSPQHFHFLDFILAYRLEEDAVFSFHVFNAMNTEYMPIPGYLAPHRSFAFQYKLIF